MSIRSYPSVMQAVFIDKKDNKLIVKETDVPSPGPGEVLIKISAAPVNPSDLAWIQTSLKDPGLNTFIPGLEGSGTVIAAGKGLLPRLWLGKRVACSSKKSSGGTWAEYMVTPAQMCFPLKSKINDEQGSMALVNPLTALAFLEIIKKERHKAIINNAAASSLGRMIELLAKKNRIPVINIVRNQKHIGILKDQGATYVLNSTSESFINELDHLIKKLNASVFFDTVCSDYLTDIIDIIPYGGSVIIYGNRSGEEKIKVNPRKLIDNNIKISAFYLGNYTKESGIFKNMQNLRKVMNLMSGELFIKINGRFPLNRAQQAIETYLEDMSEGKILLVPGLK